MGSNGRFFFKGTLLLRLSKVLNIIKQHNLWLHQALPSLLCQNGRLIHLYAGSYEMQKAQLIVWLIY
jgi:hypothetical protein